MSEYHTEAKVDDTINVTCVKSELPSSAREGALANIPECLRNSAHFMAGRKPLHHLLDIRLDGCIFIMRSPPPASSPETRHWMDILWSHLWFFGIVLHEARLSPAAIFIIEEEEKMYRRSCFFLLLVLGAFPWRPDIETRIDDMIKRGRGKRGKRENRIHRYFGSCSRVSSWIRRGRDAGSFRLESNHLENSPWETHFPAHIRAKGTAAQEICVTSDKFCYFIPRHCLLLRASSARACSRADHEDKRVTTTAAARTRESRPCFG